MDTIIEPRYVAVFLFLILAGMGEAIGNDLWTLTKRLIRRWLRRR